MITIRNKKTGEVKQVEENQLNQFGLGPAPQPSSTFAGLAPTQSTTPTPTTSTAPKITLDQLYKMSLDPKIKPTVYNRFKALYDLQNEEKKLDKLSSDEVKAKEDKDKAEGLKMQAIDVVDELLARDTGAITGLKNPIKSLTGENALTQNLFDQIKSILSLENVKFLKGQGSVSDAERDLLAKSASSLNTNLRNEDFYNELLKIKGILSGKKIEKVKSKSVLESKAIPAIGSTIGGLTGAILGPAGAIAGAGIGYAGADAARKSLLDLTGKRKLQGTENLKDVGQTLGESALAAGTAAVGEGIGAVAGKAIPAIKSAIAPKAATMSVDELLSGVTKSEAGKKVREQAIKEASSLGKKVDGTKVFKVIEKQLKSAKATATPQEAKQLDELVKSANKYWNGKSINPTTAKTRWDNAMSSFKQSGQRGDTIKSVYDGAIRDGVRKELERVAPGFEKGTKQIAEGIKIDKLLKPIRNERAKKAIKDALKEEPTLLTKFMKKFGKQIGSGVTGAISTAAAFKLLGIGKNKSED